MHGKAEHIARLAPQCRPLASSSEPKPCHHLANEHARSISLPSIWQYYLAAMVTSFDKLENSIQIHHRHVKRFHMAKRLRKSV